MPSSQSDPAPFKPGRWLIGPLLAAWTLLLPNGGLANQPPVPELLEGFRFAFGQPRWIVAFDLDGTLLRGWDGTWRGLWRQREARMDAHRLDRWLHRQRWQIIPLVVTGGEREAAQSKLRQWGYLRTRFSTVSRDGQEVWNDRNEKIFTWTHLLDDRWDQRKLIEIVDGLVSEIQTGARKVEGVAAVKPFEQQVHHRVAFYIKRDHNYLPLTELARRLVVEPLQRANVEVVEVVGEAPPPDGYTPKKKLAVKVIPYRHEDGLLSFSIVPWQGGKAGIVTTLGVDVFAGDGPNDLDVFERFVAGQREPGNREKRFFLTPADTSFEVYSAIKKDHRWCRDNGTRTVAYHASRSAAGGVLEGLERVFPEMRRTRGQRVVDWLTFHAGPLYRRLAPLLNKLSMPGRRRRARPQVIRLGR